MKVLEFAFDSEEESDYLPHTYDNHCICYTGTHDNAPLLEWLDDASKKDVAFALDYLGIKRKKDFLWAVIRAGQSSVADLFIAQMQDYLGLSAGNRMNMPSTTGNNWTWRLLPGELTDELSERILHMTRMYGRCPKNQSTTSVSPLS